MKYVTCIITIVSVLYFTISLVASLSAAIAPAFAILGR